MQSDPNDLRYIMHHLRTLTCQIKPVKNVTFGEFTVLYAIASILKKNQESKLTSTKLNEIFGTKKPATSRMLSMLERKGYITKNADVRDHRIAYLSLTPLGEEIVEEETNTYKELTERIEKRMGREELSDMISAMSKFSGILEEELEILS